MIWLFENNFQLDAVTYRDIFHNPFESCDCFWEGWQELPDGWADTQEWYRCRSLVGHHELRGTPSNSAVAWVQSVWFPAVIKNLTGNTMCIYRCVKLDVYTSFGPPCILCPSRSSYAMLVNFDIWLASSITNSKLGSQWTVLPAWSKSRPWQVCKISQKH